MKRKARDRENDPTAIATCVSQIHERATVLSEIIPGFLRMADHLRWDPHPPAQDLDKASRPASKRQRETGEVDDNDGIGRPTERTAIRLLDNGREKDRTRSLIHEAVRAIWLANDALAMAQNKLAMAAAQGDIVELPRQADTCIRCVKVGAGLKAGFCSGCHAAWEDAGRPDHDRFARSYTPGQDIA